MQIVYFATAQALEFGQRVTAFVTKETFENTLSNADYIDMDFMINVPFTKADEDIASKIYSIKDVKVLDDGVLKELSTTLKKRISKELRKEEIIFAEIYI